MSSAPIYFCKSRMTSIVEIVFDCKGFQKKSDWNKFHITIRTNFKIGTKILLICNKQLINS